VKVAHWLLEPEADLVGEIPSDRRDGDEAGPSQKGAPWPEDPPALTREQFQQKESQRGESEEDGDMAAAGTHGCVFPGQEEDAGKPAQQEDASGQIWVFGSVPPARQAQPEQQDGQQGYGDSGCFEGQVDHTHGFIVGSRDQQRAGEVSRQVNDVLPEDIQARRNTRTKARGRPAAARLFPWRSRWTETAATVSIPAKR